jgi:AraC family transcriptional regulator
VNFCLPRATFDAIAEDVDVPPIGDLNYKPGAGVADGTIANLGRSLLVAFRLPYQADRLFADHVTLAIGVHVAQTYGGLRPISRPVRGGLRSGRSAAPRTCSALTSTAPLRSRKKHRSAVCRLATLSPRPSNRGVAPHKWS